MNFNILVALISFLLLVSCKNDVTKKNVEQESQQSEEITNHKPQLQNWVLSKQIEVENFQPTGLVNIQSSVMLSDTVKNIIIEVDTITEMVIDTKTMVKKPMYLKYRSFRLFIPSFEDDVVYVYNNIEKYEKSVFDDIDGPTAMDAFTVNHFGIVDQLNHRILYRLDDLIKVIGKKGNENGEFNLPVNLNFINDDLYVLDRGNQRIQVFDPAGEFKFSFGENEGLRQLTGITSDSTNVFVADRATNRVIAYSLDGHYNYTIDQHMNKPEGISFQDGKLYIANSEGKDITVLRRTD